MDSGLKNVALVAAVAENNVIGHKNQLPWHLKNDLRRFRELTTGHTVIMGRKTFDSILERLGKPLPNRTNIVLSKTRHDHIPDVLVLRSLEEALSAVHDLPQVFVIGGEQIYNEALPFASRIHLTLVHAEPAGDARFPKLNNWHMSYQQRFPKDGQNEHDFTFAIYERRPEQSYVYLNNAREVGQWITMEKIFCDRVCPFCPDHLSTYHHEQVLHETRHWILTKNQWAYKNTRVHLLLIRRKHAEHLRELTPDDGRDILELVQWAEQEFDIEGGGFALRFGAPEKNAATVRHLHAHLLSVNSLPSEPTYEPVRFRIG